jgi:hypothetical protein
LNNNNLLNTLAQYTVKPLNLNWLGLDFLSTKLYLNSFLAMLNARNSIRRRGETGSSSFSVPNTPEGRSGASSGRGEISISFTQDKYQVCLSHLFACAALGGGQGSRS